MKMRMLSASVILLTLLFSFGSARAAVDVVATVPELGAIAREVGGNRVSVYVIARPNQDYHQVEPRPSDVARLHRADLFVRVGMDFDLWAEALLSSARNPKAGRGGPGYVDASQRIRKLEVPTERITGASGDIHVQGNPHYFYDPGNGKVIAYNILLGLRRVDPAGAAVYNANYRRFIGQIDANLARWQRELAPYRGRGVVTYHKNMVYFLTRFGLREYGNLEPKPGIPPSPAHVRRLIQSMKRDRVKSIVIESIYPRRYAQMVARETGANLQIIPYSVGSMGARTYIDLINQIVQGVRRTLR